MIMRLETARGTIEFADSGEGPAVLLLHGAMGGCDQGLLLGRAAIGEAGYRFVAPSRPGYLGTPLSRGQTPEEQADLCTALLDRMSIGEAVVVAISGGGQCALQFAIRHPGRCRRLVMISACSAPLSGRVPLGFHLMRAAAWAPGLVAAMRRRAARDPDSAARRSIPDAALRTRTLNHPEAGPLLRALRQSVLTDMRTRLPGTRNDIEQSRRPFSYAVEVVAAPVLIVHGTADEVVPFRQAEALAGRIRRAELFAIDEGRHVSLFTHLDAVRERVRGFVGG